MTPIMLVIFPVTFLLVVAALKADAERRRQQRESADLRRVK